MRGETNSLPKRKDESDEYSNFMIDPLPATITVSQPVTIIIHRDKDEDNPPDPFALGLIRNAQDGPPPEFFMVTDSDPARDTLQATITVTATGPFQIAAMSYAFDKTFFVASQTVFAVNPTETTTSQTTDERSNGPKDSDPVPTLLSQDPETSPRNNIATIVGGVIGGVAALLLLLILLLFISRRRTMQRERLTGEGVFHKDRMAVKKPVSIDGAGAGVGFAQKGKNMDRESPTTPLRESFEDRRSAATSLYSADSAVASQLGSGNISGLPTIGTTPSESMFGSGQLVELPTPLTPTSEPPTPLQSPLRARTDRQMFIEGMIFELQGRLITAEGSEQEKTRVRAMLREQIEKVKEVRESDWALIEGDSGGDIPEILRG